MNRFSHILTLPVTSILRMGCALVLLLAIGCASQPVAIEVDDSPIFYPALPDIPRIQYLATFSSSKDVEKSQSDLSNFILGEDSGVKSIKKPYGVGIFEGRIYAVDTSSFGYAVMDMVNSEFKLISGHGGGRMSLPINITIDEDGTKYITDTQIDKVLVFDREDRFVQAFGITGQFKPVDTAIFKDKLFVLDIRDHEVEVLNKHNGTLLYKISQPGSLEGDLFHPTNIKIGPDNSVYISDTTNFRVQKFTQDGRHEQSFGSVGTSLGQFARPKGIALDKESRLYVVDAAFENIQIMDAEGRLLMFFGGPGGYRDNINLPVDIEIDYDNVALFQPYAHPDFKLEYIILVSSQFGLNKVNVYGFGKMDGMEYIDDLPESNGN